jgi:cytochrome c-type biogenesis protein
MYPGFLVFLSRQEAETSVLGLGAIVSAGVVAFIMSVGLVFSALLGTPLSSVVQAVSPAAFAVLGAAGLCCSPVP